MVKRYRVVVFYLLAYAISWVPGFTYAYLAAQGPFLNPAVPSLLLLAASYGPTLAAVLTLALLQEPDETRAFRQHLGMWRAGIGWYGLVLLLPAALWAAGSLLAARTFGGGVAFVPTAAVAFPGILLANAGEEIGWRGFAFPHLLARLRPLAASLVFGVLWAGIHLPLYITVLGRFAVLVPMFLGLSVIMAWIFLRTGQGVFLMLLFHSSLDTIQFVLRLNAGAHGTQAFAAIMGVIVAVAALVLWRTGPDLGRPRVVAPAATLSGLR
jgi:membrane protease YdiL (CAAX protease family)